MTWKWAALLPAGAALLAGVLVVSGAPATSATAPKAGAPCTKVGAVAKDAQGRTLVCTKGKKGNRWRLRNPGPTPTTPTGPPYMWMGDWQQGWKKVRNAPACPSDLSTLFTHLPFDLSDVTEIVRPGYANPHSGYKPHAHVRYSPADGDGVQRIIAPADGWLFSVSRYVEAGTPGNDQVILSFFADCGVWWGFDHLRDGTLSPSLQAVVDKVPLLDGDSRGTNVTPIRVKAGEVLATAVGATSCVVERPLCIAPGGPNYFVDFGVYDPRQLNAAAQADPAFLAGSPMQAGAQKGIALCWLELFPASKSDLDRLAIGTSDYCRSR